MDSPDEGRRLSQALTVVLSLASLLTSLAIGLSVSSAQREFEKQRDTVTRRVCEILDKAEDALAEYGNDPTRPFERSMNARMLEIEVEMLEDELCRKWSKP